ncbi:unnamed protein product [Nippostrongylus brasiliensis]|uniref:Uncharacterized protein n=1 Tax=Nippostrongylus brasiliensis TaxID=27835 RepID=A0A0N4XWE6_NIPBR|nr:unnamed protein product [Nippostrongylus brasiliensis]
MKNSWCGRGPIELDESPIAETKSYVYLQRSIAWSAYGSLKEATDLLHDADLRAHLFDSTVLPALCYAAETWPVTSATAKSLQVAHRALERCLLKFTRLSQHRAGLRSSDLRQMSRLRDPADYTSNVKHRWAGHIIRRDDDRWTRRTVEWLPRDCTRPRGRPPARWSDVFVERIKTMLYSRTADSRLRHSRLRPTSWMTIARQRREWKFVLGPARPVKPGHLSI